MIAFLIAGRSIANYRAFCVDVPKECSIVDCLVCADPVAITAEGADLLSRHRAAGDDPAGALCTDCIRLIKLPRGGRTQLDTTRHGADLVERREDAKRFFSELLERIT